MTTATLRWAALAMLVLAGPAALAQTLGDEFILFVDGTNVLIPNVDGAETVADPLDASNTVARFSPGNWTEGGFAWNRDTGADASASVGAAAGEGDTLYFRMLSDVANAPLSGISIMLADATDDSGIDRTAAEALAPDFPDYQMRLVWPIPAEMHDGQWHDLAIPLPPATLAALQAAKDAGTLMDGAENWSYTGAWSLGGFGIGEVGGFSPASDDPLFREFGWDQLYRVGPFWDNSAGETGGPIYLDNVYIGGPNTSTDGSTALPTAMSGVTFAATGSTNTISWSEIAGAGGYQVYTSLEPITDVTAEGVLLLSRIVGNDNLMLEHRVENLHPERNPPNVYYAVTSLSQFGVENQDVSASSDVVINPDYEIRPYIRGLTTAEADAIFDNVGNGVVSGADFPSDHPMFVMDTSHRTATEGGADPGDDDIKGTFWVGFNGTEWFVYGELEDDDVRLMPEAETGGNSYLYDSIELAFGHYDVRLTDGGNELVGSPHQDMERGAEPDYQIRITGRVDGAGAVVGSSTWIGFSLDEDFTNSTVVEKTDTGWSFLSVIPMNQIQSTVEADAFFPNPADDEIALIPFTISINDADGTGQRESQVIYSVKPNVTNQWWNTPAEWEIMAVAGRNFMGTDVIGGPERDGFALEQSSPNPATGSAEIAFALGAPSRATVEVFNVLGQRVLTVADGDFGIGAHTVDVNTSGLASGVYVYRLTAGDYVATRRMTVVR